VGKRTRTDTATQREVVLTILSERGEEGVTAIELDRRFGIYRAGARVYDLRQEGYVIQTVNAHGKTARYILVGSPYNPRTQPIEQPLDPDAHQGVLLSLGF
jgi:hypothetical protein